MRKPWRCVWLSNACVRKFARDWIDKVRGHLKFHAPAHRSSHSFFLRPSTPTPYTSGTAVQSHEFTPYILDPLFSVAVEILLEAGIT